MRSYPVKKGLKTDTEVIMNIARKYGNDVESDGSTVTFSLPGIKKVTVECGKKTLDVETETDLSYSDPVTSLRTYNNMITEMTGFDSKERKKRMSKTD